MKKMGDERWPYQTIIETVFDDKEKAVQERGGKILDGVLLGSPIELLRSTKEPL